MIGIDNSDWHSRFCKQCFVVPFWNIEAVLQAMSLYIQRPLPCKSLLGAAQTRRSASCDAGFAFLQNALSALRRSAQPSRKRDVHRDWDCIPTSRTRTANLQCRACSGLCAHKGTACRCKLAQQIYFIISRIFSRILWSAGSQCTEPSSSFVSQRAASASFRTRSPERTSHQKQSIERWNAG